MNINFLQRICIRAVTGLLFAVGIINLPVVWMTDIMVGTSQQVADKSSVWYLEKAAEEDHVLVIVIIIVRVVVITGQSPSQSRLQAVWRMSATRCKEMFTISPTCHPVRKFRLLKRRDKSCWL